MKTKEIDFLDILYYLIKHKKFIIITTLLVSIGAVVYSLIVPFTWTSSATFMAVNEKESGFSFSSSSLFGLGSTLFGTGFSGDNKNLIAIMRSRYFSEDIIKEFNLIKLLKINYPDSLLNMEKAVKVLNESITQIDLDEETSIITISVTTEDKYLSADISNYYLLKLNEYNLNSRKSKGKQKRIFLESRLNKERIIIDSLTTEFMEFCQKHYTISLTEQTNAVISNYSDLVAQKVYLEIELELAKRNLGEDSPKLAYLKDNIIILERKINELEFNKYGNNPKYLLNLEDIPHLVKQYAELELQLEIEKKIYEFLYPQYESAKIEEIKDLPSLEIIDKAIPAGQRTSPRRARLCIISFMLAFIMSAGSMIIYELIKLDLTSDKQIRKIHLIKEILK